MKRLFSLLLAVSMLLSLTIPAFAEEVVEEIVEEVVEEIQEEVIEEELAEPEEEEIAEEIVEEVTEEPAEEVVEEVMSFSSSSAVAGSVAEAQGKLGATDLCPQCNDGKTMVKDCRNWHEGEFTLWMHLGDRNFRKGEYIFAGESVTMKLGLGNMFSVEDQKAFNDVRDFEIWGLDEKGRRVETTGMTIEKAESTDESNHPSYVVKVITPGTYLIRHVEYGTNIEHTVTIFGLADNDMVFYATDDKGNGYYDAYNPYPMEPETEIGKMWFWRKNKDGKTYMIHPRDLLTTMDLIHLSYEGDDATTTMSVSAGANGFVQYWNHETDKLYSVGFRDWFNPGPMDEQAEIFFIEDAEGAEFQDSLTLEQNEVVSGWFYYGSASAYIYLPGQFQFLESDRFSFGPFYNDKNCTPEQLENLSREERELKVVGPGGLGGHITIGYNGATFTASVPNPNPPVESGVPKLFRYRGDGSGNQICTYMDMRPGNSEQVKLWFGTSTANPKDVTGEVFVVEGKDVIELKLLTDTDDYKITALKSGYGVIGYRPEENGPIYCMTIRVTSGDIDDNYQASNYVKIAGNGIESGMAWNDTHGDTLKYYTRYGNYYYEDDTDDRFVEELALLVMDKGNYVTLDSKMADGVTPRLSNIHFEVLGCNNPDAITKTESFVYTEGEASPIKTQALRITAKPKTSFQATIAVSYTLDGVYRFTHQFMLWRNPTIPDIRIEANDLDTAGKLNAVLSSWEAFEAWVTEKHGPFTVGQQVRVVLPPVSYNDVIVAQAFSPRNPKSNQPFTLISLIGAVDDTNTPKTTMCGLIEKASVASVARINFVANGKTMTTTGSDEEFTCGILTDYKNTFRPVYDKEYLKKYADIDMDAEGYQPPSLELPADRIKDYGNVFNTAIDLSQVAVCNFSGFDYGVRSTKYGYAGNQIGNFYGSCDYGIYIDNNGSALEGGDQGADGGNATSTDYKELHFEGNDTAVKVVTLPTDAPPNVVRIHDSRFIGNDMEFDIEQQGNYYFYRNYFGDVKVYEGNYVEHKPRPGHYHKRDHVKVILNPCRRSPDMEDNTYWFYSGDDQHTVLEYGKPDILIHGDAMKELDDRADVSVVDGNNTKIVYTFHGKGGRK